MENLESNSHLIKRLFPYYKKFLRIFSLDLIFTTLTTSCDLIFPIIFKMAMDLVEQAKPGLFLNLAKLGLLHVLIFAIEMLGIYYVNYIGHAMGSRLETTMRHDLFAHCQKLSISYYDNNKIGQLMSRLTSDLFEIGEFAHHAPEDILIVLIKTSLTFIILTKFNWWLTLIIYAIMTIMFIYINHYFKKMKISNHKNKVQLGELNAKIEDSLLGIRLVKSFANEHFEQKKFDEQNVKTLNTKIEFYKTFGAFRAANRFFSNLIYLVIMIVGAILLIKRQTKIQDVMAYTGYVTGLIAAVSKLLSFFDVYQKGLTGVNRFCEIMDLPVESHSNTIYLDPDRVKGKIEFKNVQFSYMSNSEPTIKNFNLKIRPNEKIAIIGASGSGKTTICNLLKNFYKVQQGEILIDDININQIKPQNLHEIVGFVQQSVYLFTGTILDNIKFGKMNATFEEVVEATKKAKIFDFVNSLENKFDTNIGERGTKLSGGQKQQISIARLFLKNPKILILDEATSSLDSENEKIILSALNELVKNKTTITVAHKLNTIKNSDLIYLISNGEIVERGTHNELIKNKNSAYRQFYDNLIN